MFLRIEYFYSYIIMLHGWNIGCLLLLHELLLIRGSFELYGFLLLVDNIFLYVDSLHSFHIHILLPFGHTYFLEPDECILSGIYDSVDRLVLPFHFA